MLEIGIRAHDLGKTDADSLAKLVVSMGFNGIQLVFRKALTSNVDFSNLDDLKKSFSNLKIMMLGAYFNPVHPNQEKVSDGVSYFKEHLKIANKLNADFVGSETGSLMGDPWGYVPENHNESTLESVIDIFRDLTACAEKYDSFVAIEGAYQHVAFAPEVIKTILDRIASPNLKVTIDLYNFLHIGNYEQRMDIFDRCFKYLKDDIVIYHLKDFIVDTGALRQVGLGKGLMDYPVIIRRIKRETPNAYLVFEGVTGEDIKTSLEYISRLVREE